MLLILFVISFCGLREFGVEAGLKVEFEDVVIVSLDRKYFDTGKTEIFISEDEETGETSLTSTLSLIKTPPLDTNARFLLTGLSMGKYTIPTGVDMKMTLCEMLDEPIIMGPFFAVLGFSQSSCPPGPGEYSRKGYKLPVDNLPDEFPENKYLVSIELSIKGKPIISVNVYTNVEVE